MFGSRPSDRRPVRHSIMSVVPGDIDTDSQPPMAIPLRHFLVGLALLAVGGVVGLGALAGWVPGRVAGVHLLLAGWVCVTIMGAMTQFVPVWSGVALHSRRLARWQLRLVVVGLLGFVGAWLTGTLAALPAAGAVMLAGFWTFAYNLGRTLASARPWDVTERHFAYALAFLVAVTVLGLSLAVDFVRPVYATLGLARPRVVSGHATLAVFGVVLTTIVGAIYQLATMFTQTEFDRLDEALRAVERVWYPLAVVVLAAGRVVGSAPVVRAGAVAVCLSLAAVAVVVGRQLLATRVEWSPMLSRYTVAVVALLAWAAWTLPAWLLDPLALTTFGAGNGAFLLAAGVGFVVLGTLYHVVPFIIWERRYSDLLGYEDVPMIDDLYDDRLAAADFACLVAGALLLVAVGLRPLPDWLAPVGGGLLLVGVALAIANLALTIRRHAPQSLVGIATGREAAPSETESQT